MAIMADTGSAITVQGRTQARGDTGVTLKTVKPVFTKVRKDSDNEYTVCQMCRACEQVSGPQTMEGAQRIGGLWRLYPRSTEARTQLLLQGIDLRGVHVELSDTNPFLLSPDGTEVQSTRLLVSDVSLSSSNKDTEDTLLRLGCKLLSPLRYELERDESGHLTQWKTGRRYVFIVVPTSPLQRDVKIGIFNAKLYHREQKSVRNVATCYNCFEKGHISRDCPNPTKCRVCHQEGHKQGDQTCALNMSSTTTFPTLTPSPAAPSSQGQGDQPSSQGQGDRPVVQGPEDSAPGVTQGSLDSLSAESAPAPLLDSAPPCQPSPSLAASGQYHQQAGSGQEGDGAKSPSPKRSGKKKKKEKKGQNNLLKRFLSPEAPASKKEKLEVDRDSDSSWSLSYKLHAYYDVDLVISYGQL